MVDIDLILTLVEREMPCITKPRRRRGQTAPIAFNRAGVADRVLRVLLNPQVEIQFEEMLWRSPSLAIRYVLVLAGYTLKVKHQELPTDLTSSGAIRVVQRILGCIQDGCDEAEAIAQQSGVESAPNYLAAMVCAGILGSRTKKEQTWYEILFIPGLYHQEPDWQLDLELHETDRGAVA